MIYDRMERLARYRGLNANLDRLIDYVLTHDPQAMTPGKYDVDGENCWINCLTPDLVPESRTFERHMTYLDLQIGLEEGEIITVRPVEELEWPALTEETVFTEGEPGVPVDLKPGMFAIFFPWDAHNCSLSKAGQTRSLKLVGKAKL